jgi:ABC-2 type transport system ATP-binding protein/lipopolysaccharide transport system ATP-binding protein
MSERPAVQVTNLGFAYRLMRSPVSTVSELAITALHRQISYELLWALRGVSFEVGRGETLVVIGRNGAGKSTLVKALARILPPREGRVVVRGHISPIIELGAGFSAELTGAENAVLYGALLGHDPGWLRSHTDAIAAYAGVENFMDVPLRAYSSGMLGRLAFAIATLGTPDVLLIDEVLAVGDEEFRQRSAARIDELIARGTAVVLVTHGLEFARQRADRVLWLDHGSQLMLGEAGEVIDAYLADAVQGRLEGVGA